jgi:hypothetical protein
MSEQGDTGGTVWDAPNKQVLGLDPPWVEGTGGDQAEPKSKSESKLPGQHAGLDELADERGHEWSRDDLTVAEKQHELGG